MSVSKVLPLCLVLLAASCGSPDPADLTATDLEGRAVQPFRASQAKAVVLLFAAPDCPISNALAPEVRRIAREYVPRGTDFYLVYAEETEREAIEQHIRDFEYTFPALLDFDHVLVDYTGATVTPEAAVLTPGGELAYLGRINDLYVAFGKRRAEPTTAELRDALEAVLTGEEPPVARTEAIGCFIPGA